MIIETLNRAILPRNMRGAGPLTNSYATVSRWGTGLLTMIKPTFNALSDEMKRNHHAAIAVYVVANSVFLSLLDLMVRSKNDQPSKKLFYKLIKPLVCELAVGSAIAGYNLLLSKVTDYQLSVVGLVAITTACLAYRVIFKSVYYYFTNRASASSSKVLIHDEKKSQSADSLEHDLKSIEKESEDLKEDKRKLEERLKYVEMTLESTQREKEELLANAEKEKGEILLLQKSPSEALEKVQMERKQLEKELKQTKEDLQSANELIEKERDQAFKKLGEVTSEFERQKTELEETAKQKETVRVLQEELVQMTEQLDKVKTSLHETGSNSQTTRIESLEKQISDLEKALVDACSQIKEEKEKKEEFQREIDKLSAENSSLKKSLDTFSEANK